MSEPEYWLRGPVDGYTAELQPVAHALLQARQDLTQLLAGVPTELLWARVGAAAPAAFHVVHVAGALDRLLTYARGEPLNETQKRVLAAERDLARGRSADELLQLAIRQLDAALAQVRNTDESQLDEQRAVGAAGLPATVRGLLFHAAEHTTRHVGQLSTTLKVLS